MTKVHSRTRGEIFHILEVVQIEHRREDVQLSQQKVEEIIRVEHDIPVYDRQ